MKYFQFTGLLQSTGWVAPAYVGIDSKGVIRSISDKPPAEAAAIESVLGYTLPGFQNAHSHAFQYAMAGLAEKHPANSSDDFWSWREAMYRCALAMNPDHVEAVATMLYTEMIRKGYTHVAEFHYLHHDKNGKPYANLSEMGERLIAAATAAGIGITLVPVFYQKGGFDKKPQEQQRRFISKTIDEYFHLLDDTAHMIENYPHAKLGFGVHSLRAVEADDIINTYQQGPKAIPFHVHAAEQQKEIEDCIAHLKSRPVEWLLNNLSVNERFHLVHCTHMNDEEVRRLAESGAHVVICPGTEGNLGDGIFRLTDFKNAGGAWSIGTDSHIHLNPLEDLRWLDYAQRLTTHKRNTFTDGAFALVSRTLVSGRMAMGNDQKSFFEIGKPLDAVVYDCHSPLLSQTSADHILQRIAYTADASDIWGTLIQGKWIVKQGRHKNLDNILKAFKSAITDLESR
jgi:formimidoylglutamate deiminase